MPRDSATDGEGRAHGRAAPEPSPATDREPVEIVFDSRDYPPRPSRPWFIPPPPVWTGSAEWGLDDPAALKAAPLRVTASAALGFAYEGRLSATRSTREIAALFGNWIETDLGRVESLEAALGLARRGSSLTEMDNRARIGVMLARVARLAPYNMMKPLPAANAIRLAYRRWVATAGIRYAEQDQPPPLPEPALSFWKIIKTGLARPMPSEQTIARLIADDRGEDK